MSWQYALGRGYDMPQYTNINYPDPVDPPHLPDDVPCGLYERSFTVRAEALANRQIYINFEGVDSCFYLYVNHKFAAYSQVSHMTSEICVNDYLVAGENTSFSSNDEVVGEIRISDDNPCKNNPILV
jgi:beta-galactosidase